MRPDRVDLLIDDSMSAVNEFYDEGWNMTRSTSGVRQSFDPWALRLISGRDQNIVSLIRSFSNSSLFISRPNLSTGSTDRAILNPSAYYSLAVRVSMLLTVLRRIFIKPVSLSAP
jgi:hypothetical protein